MFVHIMENHIFSGFRYIGPVVDQNCNRMRLVFHQVVEDFHLVLCFFS